MKTWIVLLALVATVRTGETDPLAEAPKSLLQVQMLDAKMIAEREAKLWPLRHEMELEEGTNKTAIGNAIKRIADEEDERRDKAVGALASELGSVYANFVTLLTNRMFRVPSGEYVNATLTGKSWGSARSAWYAQNCEKPGLPTVLLSVTLAGPRDYPANSVEYRDGIRTWISPDTIIAFVGVFDVRLVVYNDKAEPAKLRTLIESFIDLDALCKMHLVDASTLKVACIVPPPPGALGKVALSMLKAANSGDYGTALSYCTEAFRKSITKSPLMEKRQWDSMTRGMALDFSDGKTTVWSEGRKVSTGQFYVTMQTVTTNGVRSSAGYRMMKVQGEWKLDGPI